MTTPTRLIDRISPSSSRSHIINPMQNNKKKKRKRKDKEREKEKDKDKDKDNAKLTPSIQIQNNNNERHVSISITSISKDKQVEKLADPSNSQSQSQSQPLTLTQSSNTMTDGQNSQQPSSQTQTQSENGDKSVFVDDFIAFGESETENDVVPDSNTINSPYSRTEKSRGKESERVVEDRSERDRDRDRDRGRYKRRHDEIDFDDGYANKRQRMSASVRKAPWVYDIDWDECKNVSEMLHHEVKAFTQWMSPTPEEDQVRKMTVEMISRAITQEFPDAKVMPFGSYETKLYLPSGDIDLVIVSDSMAYSNKVNVLHNLARVLKRANITNYVTVIAKAKVPIVKFVTIHGRFNVDISINQTNGVVGGQVVKGFLDSMGNALRSLVLITKLFLGQRSMNEVFTGGLGSYSIVCLAISFLQIHPKIRRGEIKADDNLGVLVMEFFELYGCHFNYDEVGISVRDGGNYFGKRMRGWYDPNRRGCLSIEDPIDPDNDISSGSFAFQKVRTAFAGAYQMLATTAYMRASILNSRRQGRTFQLRREYDHEDLSILSSVMGVSQETINHRKLVQEVYDRRILHNTLGYAPLVLEYLATPTDKKNEERERERERPGSSNTNNNNNTTNNKPAYSPWDDMAAGETSINADTSIRMNDDVEESGKYDIGRQPPQKRRKRGNEKDLHTVFVPHDDDEEGDGTSVRVGSGSDDDDDSGEESEDGDRRFSNRSGTRDGKDGKSVSSEDNEKKRSYWLSKGSGFGDDGYDDGIKYSS